MTQGVRLKYLKDINPKYLKLLKRSHTYKEFEKLLAQSTQKAEHEFRVTLLDPVKQALAVEEVERLDRQWQEEMRLAVRALMLRAQEKNAQVDDILAGRNA